MADIDTDPEVIKYDDYNDIIITMLTDSSGDRDEAENIIKSRLDLRQAIVNCTKERSSSIGSLNAGLFKMMTKIPRMYYSDEYYIGQFLDKFFPITPEDMDDRFKYVIGLLNELRPKFRRIFFVSDMQTGLPYIQDNYYRLLDKVYIFSHVFLMILMDPFILDPGHMTDIQFNRFRTGPHIQWDHIPSEFLYYMFVHGFTTNGVFCDILYSVESRMSLPEKKSYHLISTLYKISQMTPNVTRQLFQKRQLHIHSSTFMEETTEVIENWLRENEPVHKTKSAYKT